MWGRPLSNTEDVIIYTLEFCPNCDALKQFLRERTVQYKERDLSTPESLTELRINGVFVSEAPVLQKGERFLTSTEMFVAGAVMQEQVLGFIEGV